MKAVFLNELRLYLVSWLGWGIIIVLNLIAAFAFIAGFTGYGKFDPLFRLMEVPFALAVIIVGSRSLSKDRELGLFQLFFTSPISLSTILFAKFLALSTFFSTVAFSLLFYAVLSSLFIAVSWSSFFSGLLALILVIMFFSSLSLFASSLSANTLISIVVGIGVWMFMVMLNSLALNLPQASMFRSVLESFSYNSHFTSIISGVFSLDDLVYFFIGSFAFLKLSESRILSQIAR